MKQLMLNVETVHPVCEPGESNSRSSFFSTARKNVIEADFESRVVRVWNAVGACNVIPLENVQNMKPAEAIPKPVAKAKPEPEGATKAKGAA